MDAVLLYRLLTFDFLSVTRYILISFALLLTAGLVSAQEPTPQVPRRVEKVPFRLGVYGGYGINYHDTQASIFNGGGECGAFSAGDGKGAIFGVLGEFPIVGQWLDLTANVNYARRDGSFAEAFTGGMPILDPNSNSYVTLERRHAYTSKIPYLLVELGLRLEATESFPLYIRGAGVMGFLPTKPTFLQTEEILSPEGVVYPETHQAIRTVSSGPIADVQPWIGVSGTLGYTVPLGLRVSASPEVSYYYALNDVTPHYRWRLGSLQGGIALKYIFGDVPEPPPDTAPPPAPVYPQVALATVSPQKVNIMETIVTETFPLLPYIFFDSASALLPARYIRAESSEREAFDENNLPHRSLGTYYRILDIIGNRLVKDQGAKILLKGTTDGREEPTSTTAGTLARTRAQAVKEYLVDIWEIDPERIDVKTSATPTFPSNMQYAEGVEENRRVEIISTHDNILQPIIHERFNERSSEPEQVAFSLGASSPSGIADWHLSVQAGAQTVWERIGSGEPPATLSWKLDEEMIDRIAREFIGRDALRCTLTVADRNGLTSRSEFAVPAEKAIYPYEVSRLSLIVFDFDKSEISQQNRRMVSTFIARSLLPTSTAKITGSTDRLGEIDHNQQLSEGRAFAVRDLIVAERPEATITDAKGIGPSKLLYDNDLPEGRYYCRTVSVEVQTPIQDLEQFDATTRPAQ
jgi:outer membrane protein OmpA-like peptidoglycan-associated protein